MKTANRMLLAAALFGLMAGVGPVRGQASSYEQAVAIYVEAAAQEMRTIRKQADAVAVDDAGRRAYADVYRELNSCDALVAQLRVAVPRDFDPVKARYEKQRFVLINVLEATRKAPAPTAANAGN